MLVWLKALSCSGCSHRKKDLAERLAGIRCTIRITRDFHSQLNRSGTYQHILYGTLGGVSIVVAELVFRRDPNTMSSDGEGFVEAYSSVGCSTGFTEETLNLSISSRRRTTEESAG